MGGPTFADEVAPPIDDMARGVSKEAYDPRALLTILTATSPIPSHPALDMILRAITSLCQYAGLSECRHLVVCDGCGAADPEVVKRYLCYKTRLRMVAAAGVFGTKVEVHEMAERVGLPGVVLTGISRVRTPYILLYEHDWEVVRPIDTSGILRALSSSSHVQHIRLNQHWNYEAGWDKVLKRDIRRRAVPLLRTCAWSANPHFAKLAYYRRMIVPFLRNRPEGGAKGFEEPAFLSLMREIGSVGFDRAQRRWGVFVYGRLGDPPAVVHLDGRESAGRAT